MKKIYRRPTLAAHGRATEQTKGRIYGWGWDNFGGYRRFFDE